LIKELRFDINSVDADGQSVLLWAIARYYRQTPEFVQELLARGADPNQLDAN